MAAEQQTAQEFWEAHYGGRERVWSGRANAVLVEMVDPLAPGTALDLGCGEGGDAVWLARRGWSVTAVDVSATALGRVRELAAREGVAERVRVERHDLAESLPAGRFDLVSAQFLQSPLELPRDRVLRAAAERVAPGGLLLVVEHGSAPSWSRAHEHRFPTPREILDPLGLSPRQWRPERLDTPERVATGPNGETGTLVDVVVAVRRR